MWDGYWYSQEGKILLCGNSFMFLRWESGELEFQLFLCVLIWGCALHKMAYAHCPSTQQKRHKWLHIIVELLLSS